MNAPMKIVSVGITVALGIGAVLIGGGTPLSPAKIADATRRAADNSKAAAVNTDRAARDTRALATIMDNVRSQVDASKRLLSIQTRLHESSRMGAARSKEIASGIGAIERSLDKLGAKLRGLTTFSRRAAAYARRSSGAADSLASTLKSLRLRFDEVVKQSRRLNRKARGYSEVRDGPG